MSTLVEQQWDFLQDIAALIVFIDKCGLVATGGELFRTPYQQAEYIRTGRTKTSNSKHLKRLALDLNFFKDGELISDKGTLQPVGDYWESLNVKNAAGMNWDFYDPAHFERKAI